MDYKTIPVSREKIRTYAVMLRERFGISKTGRFPVLEVLDSIQDKFSNCDYEIVEDNRFDLKEMARCVPNENGGWNIEIKESVYEGARNNIGAYRGFIMHEIAHLFLIELGYTPIFEKSYATGNIERWCSMEWQANALTGEILIPYDESKHMTKTRLMKYYSVSSGMADFRLKLDNKKALY